jgi:hypothetical protein
VPHEEAVALDQQGAALVAIGVLAALAGHVALADIAQARLAADLTGAQGLDGGPRMIQHPIGRVVPAHMPGDGRIEVAEKLGDAGQLLVAVVDARDHQGGHLHPHPELVVNPDGIQHRSVNFGRDFGDSTSPCGNVLLRQTGGHL